MDIKAKKSLGQNFLINQGVLDKIIDAAELSKEDTVLEIGPGTGLLTEKLVAKAGRIIAVEKDHRLIEDLKNQLPDVEFIEEDILKFKIESLSLPDLGYKVVANIPYYITSHLLRTIFETWPRPKLIVLTVQKEVAQRIIAKPPDMNLLALSVQLYSEAKIISYISRGSFRPMPKVDSAIILLKPRIASTGHERTEEILKLARKAFAGKRKQLKNTIGIELLKKAGIRPESRPEELSLEDWGRLAIL